MIINLLIGFGILLLIFLGYASTKESKFHYERSGVINAPPSVVYPYISNLKLGAQWSPYEKMDSTIKKTFGGDDGTIGSMMRFDGNSKAGSGTLEILNLIPNQEVQIRLKMEKPIKGDNLVIYKLSPEGDGTRFTWSMSGDGGFMTKVMVTLIDCEKMIGDQFTEGIQNLKAVIESKK